MNLIKKLCIVHCAMCICMAASAQTMYVNTPNVKYAYKAEATGLMQYSAGQTINVCGKDFALDEITINTAADVVEDNTVGVNWTQDGAAVVVAGNLANELQVEVNGGHVRFIASANITDEITYTLSGSSNNGSYYMDGEFKTTIVLRDLTLSNPAGGALTIDNGKRIAILVEGENTLSDGQSEDGKACIYIDGHAELAGSGTLTVTGNNKHAFCTDEYMEIKPGFGHLVIPAAKGDALHVSQYYEQRGGTVTATAEGDGLDVSAKKKECERNGQVIISGGKLELVSTGDATKGIKADSDIDIQGGDVTVTLTGNAYYDTEASDITRNAALKTDGNFTVGGGTLSFNVTGMGGKGVNVTGDVTMTGGDLTVVTTGAVFKFGNDDTKPHGVKADGAVTLEGGNLRIFASSNKGTAVKTDSSFKVNGGTLVGAGAKATTVSPFSAQTCTSYTGQALTSGQTVTLGSATFTVPDGYNNPAANVVVSGM